MKIEMKIHSQISPQNAFCNDFPDFSHFEAMQSLFLLFVPHNELFRNFYHFLVVCQVQFYILFSVRPHIHSPPKIHNESEYFERIKVEKQIATATSLLFLLPIAAVLVLHIEW